MRNHRFCDCKARRNSPVETIWYLDEQRRKRCFIYSCLCSCLMPFSLLSGEGAERPELAAPVAAGPSEAQSELAEEFVEEFVEELEPVPAVDKILSRRVRTEINDSSSADSPSKSGDCGALPPFSPRKEKGEKKVIEYLVKWSERAYLHTEWIAEDRLQGDLKFRI